jgi:DNA-binding PadR family transcriptional regulator
MTSEFNWALLGLVIKHPGYGYVLAKRFDREYGDVLPLGGNSRVYSGLNELERRALIETMPASGRVLPRVGRQPKPHYRATERGRNNYKEWLLTQFETSRKRWQLFVRLLCVLEQEPDGAVEIIRRYREALRQTPRGDAGLKSSDHASGLVSRLTDEGAAPAVERMVAWAALAQQEFEALARDNAEPM